MINNDRVRFTFRLPEELFQKIKKTAEREGYSINAFMLHILWDWVEEEERK